MFKKGKGLLVLSFLITFTIIIIVNAQELLVAYEFRFPLEGDWSPLWQDLGKWNNQWNGYHLGEDVGREDADVKEYAVYPMADGLVKFANIVLGYTVIIEHKLPNNDPDGNYVCSVYYHMKRPGEGGIKLKFGEAVSMDSPIGYVSGKWEDHKSSPHLHFGIRKGRFVPANVKDPRTGFWYYPGYTVIKKNGEVQKNPNDPIHKQILADWFNPSTDPKNGTGFIERHIAKIEHTTEISKTLPVITSPLKITPVSSYYYGDIINAEFSIANKDTIPIAFSVLTVGGRDPDNQVADFTHRQNITLEPSKSYNYQGTLTLNKVGDYHFFCTYQTPDGNWNTNVDLGPELTDEDRIEDITVGQAVVVPAITANFKTTPVYPYYMGDTINAEFSITNEGSIPITFIVLTLGVRDPDDQAADFTHRQNITLKPSESYDYRGTLTLNKVGYYHFFCFYKITDDASVTRWWPITARETLREMIEVNLYFSDSQAMYLVSEKRKIPQTTSLAKQVIIELIKGPTSSSLYPTIPQGTRVNEVYIADDIVYVDLSEEVFKNHPGGSGGELMTVYSIVNSLTEISPIKGVQILVEGNEKNGLVGHVDISMLLLRDEDWIKP